jgi:ParB-like chromosome segregation protein Spo0J
MTSASQASRTSLSKDGHTVTVHIPVTFRQRAGRKQILTPSGSAPWSPAPRVDAALLKAIVRAHRWREMLENGEHTSAAELAKAEKVNDSYLSRVLRLTLVAPEIVEAIITGRQPGTVQVGDLLKPLPVLWQQQKSILYWQ